MIFGQPRHRFAEGVGVDHAGGTDVGGSDQVVCDRGQNGSNGVHRVIRKSSLDVGHHCVVAGRVCRQRKPTPAVFNDLETVGIFQTSFYCVLKKILGVQGRNTTSKIAAHTSGIFSLPAYVDGDLSRAFSGFSQDGSVCQSYPDVKDITRHKHTAQPPIFVCVKVTVPNACWSGVQLITGAAGATHVAVLVFHFENNTVGARERGVVPHNGSAIVGAHLVGDVYKGAVGTSHRAPEYVSLGQRGRQRGADGLAGDVGDLVAVGAAVNAQGCTAAGNGDSGRLGVIGDGDTVARRTVVACGVGVFFRGHGDAGRTDIHIGIGREGGGAIKLAVGAGLQVRKCAQTSAADHDIVSVKS